MNSGYSKQLLFLTFSLFNFFQKLLVSFAGWPTKMSLFFFGKNFYKNKETFKIFSPQLLEVYRIVLVETTLQSKMFHYTLSVINTMFVPRTALLDDSTALTQTIKLSTTPFNISCGMHLISLLMMSSFVFGLISQTLSFRYPLRKYLGGLRSWEEDGQGLSVWRKVILSHWEAVPKVFKCSVCRNKAPPHYHNDDYY